MKTALRVLALAAVVALLALAPANAQPQRQAGVGGIPQPLGPAAVLYDQMDSASGNGAPDQDFEAAYNAYDSEGADDFVVTNPAGWSVETVMTTGTQTAGDNITTATVNIYPDAGGTPGPVPVAGCAYAPTPPTAQPGGSLTLDLVPPCVLPSGTFWVAIEVQQTFGGGGGQHFWSNRSVQSNAESVWRNPGGGFGTGCVDWTPQTTCGVGGGLSPDFLFALLGELIVPAELTGFEVQ